MTTLNHDGETAMVVVPEIYRVIGKNLDNHFIESGLSALGHSKKAKRDPELLPRLREFFNAVDLVTLSGEYDRSTLPDDRVNSVVLKTFNIYFNRLVDNEDYITKYRLQTLKQLCTEGYFQQVYSFKGGDEVVYFTVYIARKPSLTSTMAETVQKEECQMCSLM